MSEPETAKTEGGARSEALPEAGPPLDSSTSAPVQETTPAAAPLNSLVSEVSAGAATATEAVSESIGIEAAQAESVPTDDLIPEGDAIEVAEDSVDSDEFEPEEWDDGSVSNASTSINSSIYAHEYENGRRYHSYKNGRYPIPNDDQEQNREDMKHVMMLEMTDGKLFYSPLGDNPQKVIDIGTGTGIWAIDVGDKYPSASVLGIDLSPIQPVWIPPNVKFLVDDCEDEWLNGDNYDLVHLRTMSPVLKDIPKMCRQAFEHLKPGGWMEWQELHGWMQCDDGTMPADDAAYGLYSLVSQAFTKMGYDTNSPPKLGDMLRAAGFVNVQCIVKKIPIGTWARDRRLRLVGHYLKLVIQDFLPALANRPLLAMGLNQVEREMWRAAAYKALDDQTVHRYWNFYFWYGQKLE
ncbi:S-adenosyl-L-methionine-dependent methyltransferase [Xylariales sp. PMI_506]|nr:S-adenosyl-L-methionine-dependent methyltransferase [Xylariales sp. PMI_506]